MEEHSVIFKLESTPVWYSMKIWEEREESRQIVLGAIDITDPFGNRFEISVTIANSPSIRLLSKSCKQNFLLEIDLGYVILTSLTELS